MLLIHDAFPYSDNNCNYSQFFLNKVMKELFRVAKRVIIYLLIDLNLDVNLSKEQEK